LSMHYTPDALGRYVFLLVLIWLAWSGHTLYCTRFDNDDLVQRLLVLVQSFIAAVMAANAKESLDSVASAGFGAAYAGMRVILAAQYLRARRVQETRELTTHFAAGYGTAALFWILSAISPLPARYFVWALALLIDLATPWLARQHSFRYPPDAAHYPERFGLFTIILLGEFVAAVMRGIESQQGWSIPAATTAFTSMTFGFAIWWWYFDGAQSSAFRHVKTKRQSRLFHIWTYAHLPLFVGIGISGVGFHHAIAVEPGSPMPAPESYVLTMAAAILMLSLIAIGATTEGHRPRIGLQVSVLAAVGPLAFIAPRVPSVIFVLGLSFLALLQTILACMSRESAPRLCFRET
jgi:low temperature requirement protein LtrA